jgi:O-antigen/teichoic acid export membrane protein
LVYAVLGAGVFNAGRFVALVIISKFAPPDVLGKFNWSLSTSAPVVLFFMLCLRSVHIADSTNQYPFGNFRVARWVCMIPAAVILLSIPLWRCWNRPDYVFVLIFLGVGAGKIIDALGEIYWGLYQKEERMDLVALVSAIRGLLMMVAFLLGPPIVWYLVYEYGILGEDYLGYGTAGAVMLTAGCWALVVWRMDLRYGRRMRYYNGAWKWMDVRALVVRAFPLGIVILLMTLSSAIPRWVIEASYGDEGFYYLGFFAALTYVVVAGNLVTNQVGHAASNRLALSFHDSLRRFLLLLVKLEALACAAAVAMLLVAYFFGEWLLRVLYRPEYAAYHSEFMIVVIAQCIMLVSSILGFATTQMRVFWFQVFLWALLCAVAWGVSMWLVPKAPILGGAYTVLAVALVQFAAYTVAILYGISRRPALLERLRVEQSLEEPEIDTDLLSSV